MRLYICRLAGTMTVPECAQCWDMNVWGTRTGMDADKQDSRKACQEKYATAVEAENGVVEGILTGHK